MRHPTRRAETLCAPRRWFGRWIAPDRIRLSRLGRRPPDKIAQKVRELFRGDGSTLVGDLKPCVTIRLPNGQLDGRTLRAVFDGVVQKDGDCLLELVQVAADGDSWGDGLIVQSLSHLKCHRLKEQGAVHGRF